MTKRKRRQTDKRQQASKRREGSERSRSQLRSYIVNDMGYELGEYPSSEALRANPNTRSLTDATFDNIKHANLFFGLINLSSRIVDHINRIDHGVPYAADDLAVCLRVLLRRGQGSGVLFSAIEEFSVDEPTIVCSRPATTDATIGIGLIPLVEIYDGFAGDPTIGAGPLTDWFGVGNAISYRDLDVKQHIYTWNEFVGHYANRLGGAHLDPRGVPEYIQRLDWCGAASLAMSGYLLRRLGIQAWYLIQEVLHDIADKLGVVDSGEFAAIGSSDEGFDLLEELGTLVLFNASEDMMNLVWHVDDKSDLNNLRLWFGDTVWDYSYTTKSGLSVEKHANPISKYIYQSSRLPLYPSQHIDGVHIGRPISRLHIIRTLSDLRNNRPFKFPEDYDSYRPARHWGAIYTDDFAGDR